MEDVIASLQITNCTYMEEFVLLASWVGENLSVGLGWSVFPLQESFLTEDIETDPAQ